MRVSTERDDERGMVLVFVAICLVVFCGVAALAIDLGNGWVTRRNLVTSTDAAALAAAQEFVLGGDGCASVDDEYVLANNPTAFNIECDPTGSAAAGTVTVYAEDNVNTWFAAVIGRGDYTANSATTVRWGGTQSATGLRPLALCSTATGIDTWLADTSATVTVSIDYGKTGQSVLCDSGVGKVGGNWGTIDFNGIAGGNNDAKDWTLNGYDGLVRAGTPTGTCDTEPWACYQPDPGNAIPGLKKQLDAIEGQEIVLPVMNWIVDKNGQNAKMHLMGFANVILEGVSKNPETITITFLPGLIEGDCCSDTGGPNNVSVIQPCAIDNRDLGACDS